MEVKQRRAIRSKARKIEDALGAYFIEGNCQVTRISYDACHVGLRLSQLGALKDCFIGLLLLEARFREHSQEEES